MSFNFAKFMYAAAAVSLVVGLTAPAFAQRNTGTPDDPTLYDLGVNVTALPQDTAGAKKYFAAQSPDVQRILLAACHNYVKNPALVVMPETITFCTAILSN
jgi:hypothetical protein